MFSCYRLFHKNFQVALQLIVKFNFYGDNFQVKNISIKWVGHYNVSLLMITFKLYQQIELLQPFNVKNVM